MWVIGAESNFVQNSFSNFHKFVPITWYADVLGFENVVDTHVRGYSYN